MVIELRYVAGGQFSPGTGAGIRTIAPEENCPRLGLGFRSRLGLVLGLGDNHKIAPEKNCGVGGGGGGQFASGAIVLEPFWITKL